MQISFLKEGTGQSVSFNQMIKENAEIYIDKTRALYPLHTQPDGRQMPEAYPFGM